MSTMKEKVESLYAMYTGMITKVQDPLLLGIRLYWGWQFFQTGKGKLMNIDRTAMFFADLGLPMPKLNAIMAGSTECFCGLLLLIGLGSRIFSVPLIVIMCVAYLTAHMDVIRDKGEWVILSNPDAFVTAPPFLFLLASLIIFAFGPGRISIDNAISHYLNREDTVKNPTLASNKA